MEIKYIKDEFKHEYNGEVKFSEVDSFNVVHNLAYLYWLEWARTQYLFDIGMPRDDSIFSKRMPIMTVHSEVDYYSSMRFTDNYTVLTKVSNIGDSSITFINQVYSIDKLILEAKSILVYVNNENGKPVTIPDFVREKINNYEN
ncbi:MAG: acyl-CoA thioesterase [Ignavibacteriae bacterium]|nr:acyl-CoA thioesterase [Ignavibacteriota bacterium]MCB9221091.1 acyl-CoA thioesterase [Ignavibacteria bacterium]